MSPEEEAATYYPQSLLDIMTKRELDDLVRDILADPNLVDALIKSIRPPGGAEAFYVWHDALDAFVRARKLHLDGFQIPPLIMVVDDRFRMQKDLNRKRLTPEQFEHLYTPPPTQAPAHRPLPAATGVRRRVRLVVPRTPK